MKDGISLEAISPGDAPMLAALHGACFSDRWSEPSMASLLGRPHVAGLKAMVNGSAPAGFILNQVIETEAEILTVCVDPALRRQGLGRLLLLQSFEQLRQLGVASYFLEVSQDNAAARALYAESGFLEVGRRKAYYRSLLAGDGGSDALVLRKTLVE